MLSNGKAYFYPRSPCGERLFDACRTKPIHAFLSTLSLRRATFRSLTLEAKFLYFYPRSPCGERPISIVLLLPQTKFLSTLSLRRATEYTLSITNTAKFLSTLSLRRATTPARMSSRLLEISIHALLAESDKCSLDNPRKKPYFYPRSPCGERPLDISMDPTFSRYFYPRSPCGERPACQGPALRGVHISIHALLAESDTQMQAAFKGPEISIHALLAESDDSSYGALAGASDFYPRSPCGERLRGWTLNINGPIFLSTLSLRRATCWMSTTPSRAPSYFYPRSPCGERQILLHCFLMTKIFLSTLSLRRATAFSVAFVFGFGAFLSTLSLRRATAPQQENGQAATISIHALLAESDDFGNSRRLVENAISIHALLAESDQRDKLQDGRNSQFLSTLSLRRATANWFDLWGWAKYFYPRSPCGERRLPTALRTPHHRFLSTLSLRRATPRGGKLLS